MITAVSSPLPKPSPPCPQAPYVLLAQKFSQQIPSKSPTKLPPTLGTILLTADIPTVGSTPFLPATYPIISPPPLNTYSLPQHPAGPNSPIFNEVFNYDTSIQLQLTDISPPLPSKTTFQKPSACFASTPKH